MAYETITYNVSNGVAHIILAQPSRANAINPAFAREFRAVMIEIEFNPEVKAVAITAQGNIFCAGGDLKVFSAAGERMPQLVSDMLVDFHTAIYKMNRIAKPFVAGVSGAAGGAGLALVGAFDLAVCGQSAKFTMAYTGAGVTPDGTSSYFLARHIGVRRMLDLTLTNRVLTANEAEAWGLINRVVADDEVEQATLDLAQRLANGPAWALGQAKRLIYSGFDTPLEQAGELEGVVITTAMGRKDGQEGVSAFVEKRRPNFTGE